MVKECGNSYETLFSSLFASFCPVLRVQRQKANSRWLSVERTCDRADDGIPRGLVRCPLAVPTNTPGRIRSRILAGRTVTPAQAAIALTRVLYFNSLTA